MNWPGIAATSSRPSLGFEHERGDVHALAPLVGNLERPKPRPCRRRPGRGRRGGIARGRATPFLLEQCFKRAPPAGAQGRDPQRPLEPLSVAPGQIEQRVDIGDGHALWTGQNLDNLVAGFDLGLLKDAKIKPGPVMRHNERRHSRLVHPDAEPVAGDARLRHLEQRAADPVSVADADLRVGQAIDSEILAELAVSEVVSAELSLPIAVRVDLIDEDRTMLATMAREIALTIPVEVEPPRHARAFDRGFPDSGMDGFALPRNITREADIHRKQARHLFLAAASGKRGLAHFLPLILSMGSRLWRRSDRPCRRAPSQAACNSPSRVCFPLAS